MTNGNYYNFTNIVPTAIKLGRMVTYLKGILALPRSRDKKTIIDNYIYLTSVLIAIKRHTIKFYFDGLLPIHSIDPLITWSCKIT